ncbi:hypothetical protein BKA61DRAFT_583734 [Leptodontidium sp. MPI-SDFR-AT-0119]|nr:hypothetical protein BKA61DRAFT_583734 [Leptodontidium sp. MPI-SDFR-AT-0119]
MTKSSSSHISGSCNNATPLPPGNLTQLSSDRYSSSLEWSEVQLQGDSREQPFKIEETCPKPIVCGPRKRKRMAKEENQQPACDKLRHANAGAKDDGNEGSVKIGPKSGKSMFKRRHIFPLDLSENSCRASEKLNSIEEAVEGALEMLYRIDANKEIRATQLLLLRARDNARNLREVLDQFE